MDQSRAKIGGGQPVDIGDNGLKIIERQLHGNDRRRPRRVKRLGDVSDLREGGVRVERVETQKPAVPIGKTAQDKKRRRRPDSGHARGFGHCVAATAMLLGQLRTRDCISAETGGLLHHVFWRCHLKQRHPVNLKANDGTQPNLGPQPSCKPLHTGMGGLGITQIPNPLQALEKRRTLWRFCQRQIRRLIRCDNGNAHASLQRKPRQEMFQKTALLQRGRHLQDKRFAVGYCGIGCETDRSGYDRKNSDRSQARQKYALRIPFELLSPTRHTLSKDQFHCYVNADLRKEKHDRRI